MLIFWCSDRGKSGAVDWCGRLAGESFYQVHEPMNANHCSPRTKITFGLLRFSGPHMQHTHNNPDQSILPPTHAISEAKQQ